MNNIYNKAKQEYETGTITIKALAKKYNCSSNCMSRNLKKLGVNIKKAGRSHELLLKLEQARKEHKEEGKTLKELANELNISSRSISEYIKSKNEKILTNKCSNRIDSSKLKVNENYFKIIDREDKAY